MNNFNDLKKDLIIYVGKKLSDKDLLALSATSRNINQIVRQNFKEYIVVLTDWGNFPILLIEKSHPKYYRVIKTLKKGDLTYKFHRFLTTYPKFWLTKFNYHVQHRMRPEDPRRFTGNEYNTYRSKNTIVDKHINYIHRYKSVAVNQLMNDANTILDALEKNKVSIFDEAQDDDENPKNRCEFMDLFKKQCEKEMDFLQFGESYYGFNMMKLYAPHPQSNKKMYLKGEWKGLIGKKIKKSKLRYSNKNLKFKMNRNGEIKRIKNKKGIFKFKTHDNGGRPFKVFYNVEKKWVHVFKSGGKKTYIPVIKYKNIIKFFAGDSGPEDVEPHGNSILIHASEDRYVHIGASIYEFTVCKGDRIKKYYSEIGNSDVPYPVAKGENNVYFMLDQVYVPILQLQDVNWYDAYYVFYGHADDRVLTKSKFSNVVEIHSRI